MTATGIDERDRAAVAGIAARVVEAVRAVYVGPPDLPELLLTALLARGHVLLEGVPGVAKTTLAKAFAATLGCRFRRVQFTPDLLPADITGTYVFAPREGKFELREGPIFANIVLGDEINRAPAKTQSALLEAMQEQQVTIEGDTRALDAPFMVLATQNPVEQAGTYPLPEAQIDRFLVRLVIGYPVELDEQAMLRRFMTEPAWPPAILNPAHIVALQNLVTAVHVQNEIIDYVVRLARHTREHPKLALGASPRAALSLLAAARARALLSGRDYVLPDDVKALAEAVLAHRLLLTADAEMEGVSREEVVRSTLAKITHRPGS